MDIGEYLRGRGRYRILGSIVLASIAAVAAWWIVAVLFPMPPRMVVMATGPQGGAYADWGARYREILKRKGFELRLLPTAGTLENLALLRDPRSGVGVAFVQAGLTTSAESSALSSLGTVSYEPLWFFCRGVPEGKTQEELFGKRLAIGAEGSGTRALMLKILALNGIGERDIELLPLPPEEAKEKLLRGEIDAAAMVTSWESPVVQQLFAAQDIGLASFPRADAYLALHPSLNKVIVPAGVIDLRKNVPPAPVTLLASKATLVIRQDMHPALQYLLLEAASQIHSGPGFFHRAGQFPVPEGVDLPLTGDARHFYKSGPPFLQRYLPFWLAVLGERLLILIIPLVGIVFPLLQFMPMLYGWGMQRRIYRLYGELKLLEIKLADRAPGQGIGNLLSELDNLEVRVNQLRLPLTFMPMLYTLRQHIDMARERLERQSVGVDGAGVPGSEMRQTTGEGMTNEDFSIIPKST